MLGGAFAEASGVAQILEHSGRDDKVEQASQFHRLRVRDEGVIPASLHLATWSGTMSMPTHDRETDASRAWEVRSRPTSNSPPTQPTSRTSLPRASSKMRSNLPGERGREAAFRAR